MRLSIIIPVYNVEKYVAKCLDSVLAQDIPPQDYEIIVVNDESPDDSESVIAPYAQAHHNVKYVSRPNGGPGAARNTGLECAMGDYIWFVDADDTIAPHCLGGLLDYVESHRLDLCEFYIEEKSGAYIEVVGPNHWLDGKVVDSIEFVRRCTMPCAACFNIISRHLFVDYDLKFIEGIYHEDLELNTRIVSHCKRISFYHSDAPLYTYVINRDGSTMTNPSISHTLKRIDSYITVLGQIRSNFPFTPSQRDFSYHIYRLYNDILAFFIPAVIQGSSLPHKSRFYYDMMRTNQLDYNLSVVEGIQKVKYLLLSRFRYSYHAGIVIRWLFDSMARIKNAVQKR